MSALADWTPRSVDTFSVPLPSLTQSDGESEAGSDATEAWLQEIDEIEEVELPETNPLDY